MRTKIQINGVDFAPWVSPGGMTQSTIYRRAESRVTLDGIDHRSGYPKRAIELKLVTMRDDVLNTLMAALPQRVTATVSVNYTDLSGTERTAEFYVSDLSASAKIIRQGVTYWEGFGFKLEER